MKLKVWYVIKIDGRNVLFNTRPSGHTPDRDLKMLIDVAETKELLEYIREAGSLLQNSPGVPIKDKAVLTHEMSRTLDRWTKALDFIRRNVA